MQEFEDTEERLKEAEKRIEDVRASTNDIDYDGIDDLENELDRITALNQSVNTLNSSLESKLKTARVATSEVEKRARMAEKELLDDLSAKNNLEKEIEAVIFAAAEPLDVDTIESKISKKTNVAKSLEKLQLEYSSRGINLVCIKDKWSFRTSPKLSGLMTQEKTVEKKLSRAAIETLAIIVYHQPVTRAEIEEIRGVAFGTNTLEILMELDWVKPGGRKDVPGKPIQYLTTDGFLSHFNLQKLSCLLYTSDAADE